MFLAAHWFPMSFTTTAGGTGGIGGIDDRSAWLGNGDVACRCRRPPWAGGQVGGLQLRAAQRVAKGHQSFATGATVVLARRLTSQLRKGPDNVTRCAMRWWVGGVLLGG